MCGQGDKDVGGRLLRLLLASSSVAALLVGSGAAPAFAASPACKVTQSGGTAASVSNSSPTGNCILIDNGANVTGSVSNTGTLTANTLPLTRTGIIIINSTIGGTITNASTISALSSGIVVDAGKVSGGIANSGTINAGGNGIFVQSVPTFIGGITNSGRISFAGSDGIFVNSVSTFSGVITNSGTLIGVGAGGSQLGISVNNVSVFSGGITNSGMLSAVSLGIRVSAVSTFIGNISNSGTILAGASNVGISIEGPVSIFNGGITNSGTISAGSGIVVGTVSTFLGAIVNSGTIIGSGGTAINLINAPAVIAVDITGGAISGNILGSGTGNGDTVNFELGNGSFAYANTIAGMQAVNVVSGTLFDSGAITAAGVTVASGGTLAPGLPNTIGTLTINGNLAFNGGNYEIQLTPSAHAFATVSGTVSISGGSVVLSPAGPLGAHYSASTFAILTSTGTLSGIFDPTVSYAGSVQLSSTPSLSYDNHDVLLSYGNAVVDLATPPGGNINQQNVISGINNAILGGSAVPAGFQQLTGLSGAAYLNALTQLDGEDATGTEKGAFDLMTQFLDLMLDPYVGSRGNSGAGGGLGFAPDQPDSLPPDIALAYASVLKAPPQPTFEQRWSAWGAGFGGSATTNGDPVVGSNNVTTNTYGYAAGMDYRYSPDTVLGFSLAGGGTSWNLAQGLGTGRSNAFLAGIYGVTHQGPIYLAGALAFANNWFTTNRIALGDQLTADFQGQSYAARLEGGYRYAVPVPGQWGIIGITPYAAVQAQDFHTPTYSETDLTGGGFGLTYNAMNGTDTRSELGGRFDDLTALNNMPLILRARVAWAHDWVTNPALNATFQTLPGSAFTVNGAPIPPNSALTTASAELYFSPRWSLTAKFDGEFASGSQLYAGTGTLRYTW